MARTMAKNQADIRRIKYEKLKQKIGQVEYEIYQDDYRLPQYRFYKKYMEPDAEEYEIAKANNVPCANCFDNFQQADEFHKGQQIANMQVMTHNQHELAEDQEKRYGKGPLFNRIVTCLCGSDSTGRFKGPGKTTEREDNTDLDRMDLTPDYRVRQRR